MWRAGGVTHTLLALVSCEGGMRARSVSRQRAWQVKHMAAGCCKQCGKPRPPDLQLMCRICQDKWNDYQRASKV